MGKTEMGIATRNVWELDKVVTGLEEAVSALSVRVAHLEAWAASQDPPPQEEPKFHE